MRKIMDQLLALQGLQFDVRARTAASKAEVEKLRAEVPAPILAHYERLVARGKKGVAYARNGVCSECHLRITRGKLASLSDSEEIHLCDNCGRYLCLPQAELSGLTTVKAATSSILNRATSSAAHHVA